MHAVVCRLCIDRQQLPVPRACGVGYKGLRQAYNSCCGQPSLWSRVPVVFGVLCRSKFVSRLQGAHVSGQAAKLRLAKPGTAKYRMLQ